MPHLALRPADWQAILAAPEGEKAEVLAGELLTSPRPTPGHGRAQALLSFHLSGPFDLGRGGPGGWWIVIEPDVRLGEHDIVSPDLAGARRERMPEFPTERPVEQAPDWICEVLSPATVRRDRTTKADLYLRYGVRHYWLIDPVDRVLEAFEAVAGSPGRWLRLGAWSDGDQATVAPFEAVEIDVGTLFPPPAAEVVTSDVADTAAPEGGPGSGGE